MQTRVFRIALFKGFPNIPRPYGTLSRHKFGSNGTDPIKRSVLAGMSVSQRDIYEDPSTIAAQALCQSGGGGEGKIVGSKQCASPDTLGPENCFKQMAQGRGTAHWGHPTNRAGPVPLQTGSRLGTVEPASPLICVPGTVCSAALLPVCRWRTPEPCVQKGASKSRHPVLTS
jgi:hypothetical protein